MMTKRYISRPRSASAKRRKTTIPRSLTTYRADVVALPASRNVIFEYDSILTGLTAIGQVVSLPVCFNDVNDFDRSSAGVYGNKQPLYYDTLVNSSNYTNTRVESWEATFDVINLGTTPLQVFCVSASSATNLFDSETKASNLPGVTKVTLTPATGSKAHTSITVKGNIKDLYAGYPNDSGLSAGSNASPANLVFGGLTLYCTSSTVSAAVSVRAKLNTMLFVRTAVIS